MISWFYEHFFKNNMKTYLLWIFVTFFTHSQVKDMSITSEMRQFFENLMEPPVTNEKLEELLKYFQDERVKRFKQTSGAKY